jgi:hypothetical protein
VRAGPLSTEPVIELLNHYFLPVYLTIDAYEPVKGTAPAEEKQEFKRLCGDISYAKKGIAFIISPQGKIIDTFISSPAVTPEHVQSLLRAAVDKVGTPRGSELGQPLPQAPPPQAPSGGIVLHLTARYVPRGPGWARMPAEDWIVLEKEECDKLLGAGRLEAGRSWKVDDGVAVKLLKHFYPPCLNFYLDDGRLDQRDLSAKVVSVANGEALVRLDGRLKMRRNFTFAKEDNLFAEADVVGYLKVDPARRQVRSVQIVTDNGTYAGGSFGVAACTPPE